MEGRYKRAWVAATLLCTLLVPAVGSVAADQEDLDEVADELEAIRDRIELHEQQAGSLKEKVETVSADISDLEVAINALNAEIEKVQAKASVAQARIDETEKAIDKVKDLAIDQAVALYKGGMTGTLDALLSSTSLGELNDRIQMLGITAQENTAALVKYGRLKVTLEDQYDELFTLQQDLNVKLADREEYQAELEQQKESLVADIAQINEKLEDEKADEAHKEEQYDDIRDQILAAQAAAASSAPVTTPTTTTAAAPNTGSPSASGYIWPLNGAVTSGFGYRWGSMHEGIDIDGYTGQPVVASKSGTVISSGDSGDGYGTKVVIDHGGGFTTLYAHLSSVSASGSVSQGQVIGAVGCTGSCTGDHLHFEVRVNGTPQNPLSYLP